MSRYFVSAYGPDRAALIKCLSWLADGEERGRCVVFAALSQIESSIFAEVVGRKMAKLAVKERKFTLPGSAGRSARVFSDKTLPSDLSGSRVLVPWARDKTVKKVDEARSASILLLEWDGEATRWSNWGYDELGSNPQSRKLKLTITMVALVSLAKAIPAKNLLNSTDRGRCIELFEILTGLQPKLDLNEVRAILTKASWPIADIESVVKIGRDVYSGKHLRRSPQSYWAPNIVEIWQAAVDKNAEAQGE